MATAKPRRDKGDNWLNLAATSDGIGIFTGGSRSVVGFDLARPERVIEPLCVFVHLLRWETGRSDDKVLELLALLVLVGESGKLVDPAKTITTSDLDHGVPLAADFALGLRHGNDDLFHHALGSDAQAVMNGSIDDFEMLGVLALTDDLSLALLSLLQCRERAEKAAALVLVLPDQMFEAEVDRHEVDGITVQLLGDRVEDHPFPSVGIEDARRIIADRGQALYDLDSGENHVRRLDLLRTTRTVLLDVAGNFGLGESQNVLFLHFHFSLGFSSHNNTPDAVYKNRSLGVIKDDRGLGKTYFALVKDFLDFVWPCL